MNINGIDYVDGGLGNNNPIRLCLAEKQNIWGNDPSLGCIVSLGTGELQMDDVGKGAKLIKTLKVISTDKRKIAREFQDEMQGKYGVDQKVYFRFSVSRGLEDVGLEECSDEDRGRIAVATQDYLLDVSAVVQKCSTMLLEQTGTQ